MSQQTAVTNPFMLLLNPEFVLSAMERSEKLSGLNRRSCSPLDRPVPTVERVAKAGRPLDDDDEPFGRGLN